MTIKNIQRLICFLPYYFALVIAVSYVASLDYNFLDPPPPNPDPFKQHLPFSTGSIMFRIMVSHVIGLIVYCVISLPINIVLTFILLKKQEQKTGTVICFSLYILALVALLFCFEIFNLAK